MSSHWLPARPKNIRMGTATTCVQASGDVQFPAKTKAKHVKRCVAVLQKTCWKTCWFSPLLTSFNRVKSHNLKRRKAASCQLPPRTTPPNGCGVHCCSFDKAYCNYCNYCTFGFNTKSAKQGNGLQVSHPHTPTIPTSLKSTNRQKVYSPA